MSGIKSRRRCIGSFMRRMLYHELKVNTSAVIVEITVASKLSSALYRRIDRCGVSPEKQYDAFPDVSESAGRVIFIPKLELELR